MPTEPLKETVAELEAADESISILTAGDILREERQRLGLNEKEVADQLHITMHYVKALESNSYEKLPGAVFAKGYLKSYALLLGLDVENLLSRYDDFTHKQEADIEEESRLSARRKKDRNKPFVIVSLVIFVVGFLGLWLVNSLFGEESVSDVPNTVEAIDSARNVRPALSQAAEQQLTTRSQLTVEVAPEEASVSSASQPTVAQAAAAPELLVELESDSIVDSEGGGGDESDESDVSPSLEDLTTALQALRTEQAAQPEPAVDIDADQSRLITIEAVGNDVLRITFTGESWVEVNDSESQQVYRDIRAAGDVLEITGSAPFNILLGDAPFTRMSLNGDEIDLSADIRIDNSARLTVGL